MALPVSVLIINTIHKSIWLCFTYLDPTKKTNCFKFQEKKCKESIQYGFINDKLQKKTKRKKNKETISEPLA